MTNRVTSKTLTLTAASADSTGWIPVNNFVPDSQVAYTVGKAGSGTAPVLRVEGTLQDVLASGSVAPTAVFGVVSAAAASATGVNIAAALQFPVNALRLSTISGGSGAATLNFTVLQTGY